MIPLAVGFVAAPQTPKPKIVGFNICQYDLPGSQTTCTAIAVVAAKRFLAAEGRVSLCFSSHDQVLEILAQGVAWHSRWLVAGEGRRAAFLAQRKDTCPSEFSEADTMATVEEICALSGLGMRLVPSCYYGCLKGQCAIGHTIEEAIKEIFSVPVDRPQCFVLTTNGFSTMIGRNGHFSVIFDSHRRSSNNGLPARPGTDSGAVVVHFPNYRLLLKYIQMLYSGCTDSCYSLEEIVSDAPDTTEETTPNVPNAICKFNHFRDTPRRMCASLGDFIKRQLLY